VIDTDELTAMADVARSVHLSASLIDYMVAIAEATRRDPHLERGASPRATLALAAAVRARAAASGRTHGVADDVKVLARPVLQHRLVASPRASVDGRSTREILAGILAEVPAPRSRDTR
jgi:MoxR-like ATPase